MTQANELESSIDEYLNKSVKSRILLSSKDLF